MDGGRNILNEIEDNKNIIYQLDEKLKNLTKC